MTKRTRASSRRGRRETNWLLIGGIVVVGIVVLALLALTLRNPDTGGDAVSALAGYCQDNPDNCVTKGNPDAPVTLVEVSDYGCSHCRDFNLGTAPLLEEEYVDSDNVYWVILPYALGETTIPAAASALCAAEQDAFFAYHHKLFEYLDTPIALTPAAFLQSAGDLALNLEEFNSCLESGRYTSIIRENATAATRAGVQATPTFFVNGEKLEGNYPIATFRQQFDTLIAGAGS
jgi:protein-disulfide isomerase